MGHGFGGFWGVVAVGIFCDAEGIAFGSALDINTPWVQMSQGQRFGTQFLGAFTIMCWTLFTAGLMFKAIDLTIGLRVSEEEEKMGMDKVEHGGKAFHYGIKNKVSPSLGAENDENTKRDPETQMADFDLAGTNVDHLADTNANVDV